MASSAAPLIAYNRRIDGMRAVAVAFVVLWHWFPQDSWINWPANGSYGVDLFFVLSGYLITSILLTFRAAVEGGGKSVLRALGDFYVRRSLRLFPLYYVVLAGVSLLPAAVTGTSVRSSWQWYAPFAQNVMSFLRLEWDGFLAHFWSLAVEEQYYLLWGVVVLVTPLRWLPRVAIAATVVAITTRAVGLAVAGDNELALALWRILTPACFDGLGLGSLVALAREDRPALDRWLRRQSARLVVPCLLIAISYRPAPALFHLLGRTAIALLAVRLLYWALDGRPGIALVTRLMEAPLIVGFGRRSYGLYVFHNIVPFLWRSTGSVVRSRLPGLAWMEPLFVAPFDRLAWAVLLILLAYGSWRFFESPINALKNRFAP